MQPSGYFDPSPFDDFRNNDKLGSYRDLLRRVSLEPARDALLSAAGEQIATHSHLIDPELLAARSAANVVVNVVGELGIIWHQGLPVPGDAKKKPSDWIRQQVFEAMNDLMQEDAEAYSQGLEQPEPSEPRHQYLISWLDVPPSCVLGAAVRFNGLSTAVRKCFFAVFIEEEDKADLWQFGLSDDAEIKRQAEVGLRAIIDPSGPNLSPPIGWEGLN